MSNPKFWAVSNMIMLIKQFKHSRSLVLVALSRFQIVFSRKVNLLFFLYLMVPRNFLLHLIRSSHLLKSFQRTLILMSHVSLYLHYLLELNWSYSSNMPGLGCLPVLTQNNCVLNFLNTSWSFVRRNVVLRIVRTCYVVPVPKNVQISRT